MIHAKNHLKCDNIFIFWKGGGGGGGGRGEGLGCIRKFPSFNPDTHTRGRGGSVIKQWQVAAAMHSCVDKKQAKTPSRVRVIFFAG